MAYTIEEFRDNNILYNYFLFASDIHELIIDVKEPILKLD